MGQLGPCLVSILAVSCVSRLTSRGHSRATEMAQSSPFSLYYIAYPGLIFFNWVGCPASGSSREVKCTKCQCPFQVPLKGAEDLPTNYFTAGVVTTTIKKESVDPNNVICQICEKTQATEFCQDCALSFCADRKKGHLKPRATARHQFIAIDEALKGGSSSSAFRILHCQKHPQYEVNSYCKTDQTAVCPQCVVDAHIGHDVSRLVDFSKGFKDTLSTLVNKVRLFSFFDTYRT